MGYWTDFTIHVPIQLQIFISQAISIAWAIHVVDYMSDHKTHNKKAGVNILEERNISGKAGMWKK